ncbi:MAG: hypothetical protein LKE51_10530 [Selenomonas sp.]|nr:hypothetical protein [Selenomonas sp.]
MQKNCYWYTLSIQLKYNYYDLREKTEHMTENVYRIEEPIEWDENVFIEGQVSKAHFSITRVDENTTNSTARKNELARYFLLTVTKLSATTSELAWDGISEYISRICRSVTLVLNGRDTANKAAFQPRVFADYKTAKTEEIIRNNPVEELHGKENDKVICLSDRVAIHEELRITCILPIMNAAEKFNKYYMVSEYKPAYILDQLYMAIGDELITSKFFHLASIIEFIEREYNNLSNSKRLFFEKSDRKKIRDIISKALGELPFDESRKKKLLDSIGDNYISKITDIGRNDKLNNILHNMQIDYFMSCNNNKVVVDKKYCEKITTLRNKYFHAIDRKKEKYTQTDDTSICCNDIKSMNGSDYLSKMTDTEQTLEFVVAELICLCTRIADFAVQDANQQNVKQ